jgi:uncharacterized protein YndB with AHSA1/START domain
MDLDPKTDLSFTRTLPIPPEIVWKCWTSPAHIPHFFVPRPHRVIACEIDLRVGGRFNTVFQVDGQEMRNEGVFLELIPQEKLVFTDAYTEGWKPKPEPFMTAILELQYDRQGGTIYTATARHRTPELCEAHKQMGFYEGWGIVVDQLVDYAQSL